MNDNSQITEQLNAAMAEKIVRVGNAAKRMIWVTFQREGVHSYPAAAIEPGLADVSFLGSPHRHIFHFKVSIQVFHNDRDIVFIQFKRWLEGLYHGTIDLNNKSCEMISDELYVTITGRYPNRDIEITVSEDNENGCTIYYNQTKSYQQLAI